MNNEGKQQQEREEFKCEQVPASEPSKMISTPKNYMMLTDSGKELFRIDDGVESRFDLNVSGTHKNGQKRNSELTRRVYLNREELPASLGKKLTDYDLAIYNALCSVWEAGDRITTSSIIYKTFAGEGTRQPTAAQKAEILASVDKMRMLGATIEFEQESEEWGFNVKSEKVIRRGLYRGYFILATIAEEHVNGVLVNDAIKLYEEPIFYTLAKMKNQISAYPRQLIRLQGHTTKRKISLRDYLLERIGAMKHGKKKDEVRRTIRLESAMVNCGIVCDYDNRKAVSRAAADMKSMLTGWVEEEFISGFCYDHAGKKLIIAVTTENLIELRCKHKHTEIIPVLK